MFVLRNCFSLFKYKLIFKALLALVNLFAKKYNLLHAAFIMRYIYIYIYIHLGISFCLLTLLRKQ